ncbi:hypothetical protein [Micromonospora sp. NPDC000442]|uniref:hypothetical protein n=1 Tax=Micromonospora sp. NPDC000442 TaxID=3364217 RepID=UPI0036BC6518
MLRYPRASSIGPAVTTAATAATASSGIPSSTFSWTNHQPRPASTATDTALARVNTSAAPSSTRAALARPRTAVTAEASHAPAPSSAQAWSRMVSAAVVMTGSRR